MAIQQIFLVSGVAIVAAYAVAVLYKILIGEIGLAGLLSADRGGRPLLSRLQLQVLTLGGGAVLAGSGLSAGDGDEALFGMSSIEWIAAAVAVGNGIYLARKGGLGVTRNRGS